MRRFSEILDQMEPLLEQLLNCEPHQRGRRPAAPEQTHLQDAQCSRVPAEVDDPSIRNLVLTYPAVNASRDSGESSQEPLVAAGIRKPASSLLLEEPHPEPMVAIGW